MKKKHISRFAPVALLALALTAGNATARVPDAPQDNTPTPNAEPPDIEIREVGYGGTGCPSFPIPSATVILSEDKRSLSILFDQYVAQTFMERTRVRKSCNVAVSLAIPGGFTVTLLRIDYRGYADIPPQGYGRLRAEYFFAGEKGPVYLRDFYPGTEDYFFRNYTGGARWSPCGEDVIARANTSVLVEKGYESPDEAYLSVDTADLRGGIVYHIDWNVC